MNEQEIIKRWAKDVLIKLGIVLMTFSSNTVFYQKNFRESIIFIPIR